jgi:F-type H+-transporting ATPase subunit alpha
MKKQVLILYAGTRGYLDPLGIEQLAEYETRLYDFVEQRYPQIYEQLEAKQAFDEEVEVQAKAALEEFNALFIGPRQ